MMAHPPVQSAPPAMPCATPAALCHGPRCPVPCPPAGFDKCKAQRAALEGYVKNREAFGRQGTSLEHSLGSWERQQQEQEQRQQQSGSEGQG